MQTKVVHKADWHRRALVSALVSGGIAASAARAEKFLEAERTRWSGAVARAKIECE